MGITDLQRELNNGKNEFIGETIQISGNGLFINEISLIFILSLSFHDCVFKGTHLEFENINMPEFYLGFFNCSFEISLDIKNCNFKRLGFKDCKSEKDINIIEGNYNNFYFRNTSVKTKKEGVLSGNLSISNIKVEENISMDNLNIRGTLDFSENILSFSEKKSRVKFSKSTFNEAYFRDNEFLSKSYFEDIETKGLFFHSCEFQKLKFNNTNFSKCTFDKCDFLSTTWFENCENLNNSELRFVACEFKGFSLFNKSKINFLDIDRCTFDKSSSFTDAEFNTLKLFEVKFGGGAYFDEMKINKVLDKSYLKDDDKIILEWKRTLRAIKQESQKTENKIDFNNYRNYELAAHYKELKLRANFKDTSILWATRWSSNFGNWFWALWFTILSGLFWYSILYRIENSGVFNPEKANDFFVGAFRFFLVTDFFNPLENDRTYLENGWSWLIFILGKIFIAFGIYEMIQSFRKFKA